MGKSSLMVRAAMRLRAEGAAVAVLDLASLGRNLSVEQWYHGMISRIGRQLDLEEEIEDLWRREAGRLSPLQRWEAAIERIVLPRTRGPVVIFIDEIDVVGSLPFPTDEFFAFLRSCYNRRTEEASFSRLTFCLIGVASPADLISDPRLTPFNIGRRIELNDFTETEASVLAAGLGPKGAGEAALRRVLYWTGGHPYMTQRLCRAALEEAAAASGGVGAPTAVLVDQVCARAFLSRRPWEQEEHLLFVRDRMLRGSNDTAGLLELYGRIRRGRRVADDDDQANPHLVPLRLAGIVRAAGGRLRVRNRIYAAVFDDAWITANMPDAERQRQRAAFRRGILRTLLASGAVMAVVAGIRAVAVWEAREAMLREREVRRILYRSDMQLAKQALDQGNATRLRELLGAHRADAFRNFAWPFLWRRYHAARLTLDVGAPVYAVAFDPSGRTLVTADMDGAVGLWDAATGTRTRSLANPGAAAALCAAFSPDGRRLAVGREDGTAQIWDVAGGRALRTLRGHRGMVWAAVFSPDGAWLATAGGDATVRLWQPESGAEIGRLEDPRAVSVGCVAVSPDGTRLASGGRDGALTVWDTASRKVLRRLRGHQDAVTSVAFSPEGKRLFSGSQDSSVRLWDAGSGREIGVRPTPARHPVGSLVVSPDGRTLAVAGRQSGALWLWDAGRIESGAHVGEAGSLIGHTAGINVARFSPDGRWLATGSWDGTVRVWEVSASRNAIPLRSAERLSTPMAFSRDGRLLAAVRGDDDSVRVWDAATGRQGVLLRQSAGKPVAALAFTPDHRELIVARDDGIATVYGVATGEVRETFPLDTRLRVSALAVSPDGRWLAVGMDQGWELRSRDGGGTRYPVTAAFRGHSVRVVSLAFSPDGKHVLSGSDDRTAKLWDVAAGRAVRMLRGHGNSVTVVAFSDDGRTLATGGADATVKLWERDTGQETLTLEPRQGTIGALSFAPGGFLLKTVGHDQTIRRWRAATPAEVADQERRDQEIARAAEDP
jgi:WD40 repeat protein